MSCVCGVPFLWRGGVSCPVSAAWHSCDGVGCHVLCLRHGIPVTGWGVMSWVCGMAFLCGITLVKVLLQQTGTVVIWPQMLLNNFKPYQTKQTCTALKFPISHLIQCTLFNYYVQCIVISDYFLLLYVLSYYLSTVLITFYISVDITFWEFPFTFKTLLFFQFKGSNASSLYIRVAQW